MIVLITGVAGVLGSHMADRLISEGHEVYGIDNLMTGNENNINKHWSNIKQFKFYKLDITDTSMMEASNAFQRIKFDQVYNFACPASPPLYQKNPVHTLMTCIVGTKNVLDIAAKNDAVFFQASTSEIYGDPWIHPQNEDYRGNVNTVGPRSCYDEGKRAAETLCMDYHRTKNVRVKIARIFNTYSERNNAGDGRVIPNFITQALRGEDLTVYGDGSQTRSLCYWPDAIEAYYRLVNQTDPAFVGPVNIGNPHEVSMIELANKIIEITDSKSKIVFKPLPIDDPERRQPDITLAKNILQWEPQYSLLEGLSEVIHKVRNNG